MLLAWGFTPKVLAYIPNVRGMVTGLADRPAQAATVHKSANGYAVRQATASPEVRAQGQSVRLFRAAFPGEPGGVVGQLPVLRLIAQEFSPHPAPPVNPSPYGGRPSPEAASREPRWAWDTTFLGSLTAMLRKEVVGVTPDGLRINWHVTKGSFVGPGLDAIVLPGAADWMRIRRDGVANVSVQACFETREGVRVYGSYGGIFDLGPDGFARALRDEYDQLPPVVVTPTYATADARLEWLNRAQCIGVGRVDMRALRVEFDVYVVRVGQRAHRASNNQDTTARPLERLQASLYDRVGGPDAIAAITDDFVAGVLRDRHLARFFTGTVDSSLRQRVIDLLCQITGGPCVYTGRDMKTAHKGMGITESDWRIAVDLFTMSLNKRHIAPREQSEFLLIIQNMKSAIVETPGRL